MKKNVKTILIAIIAILVLGIGIYFVFRNVNGENREYEVEKISNYKFFVLKKDDKVGVIDGKGNTVVPALYDDVKIPNPTKAVFICYEDNGTKVLNEEQEEIYTQYEEILPLRLKNVSTDLIYEKKVLQYKKDGKYGLIGIDGKELTKPIYDEIATLPYKEGEILVKENGKYGVINQNGTIMVKPNYDWIEADGYYDEQDAYKYDGYIVKNTTQEGYRYGYVSIDGIEILPVECNELKRITSAGSKTQVYLLGAKNGQYGVWENEKQLIAPEYQSISFDETNNVFVVQKGKKYGMISIQGKTLLDVKYAQIDSNGKYFYVSENNETTEVYDNEGKLTNMDANLVILDTQKENTQIYILTEQGKTTYSIYQNGQKMTTEEYNYLEYLYGDYFIAAKKDGKLIVINTKGEIKTQETYSSIQRIQGTYMVQATNGTTKVTSIFNNNMEKVAEMKEVTIQSQGNYKVIKDEQETKYFDENGKEYTNIEVFPENGLYAKEKDGKWGFVDKQGNTKVEFIYDKVTELNEFGFAAIQKDGKWGAIKSDGTVILEPTYKDEEIKKQIQGEPSFIGTYYRVSYGSGENYYI